MAGALIGVAAPAQAAYSDPLTTISTTGLGLKYIATPPSAITALDAALPNADVPKVLASANHPMTQCDSGEAASLPINPAATRKMCWDAGDDATAAWNP